MLKRLLFILFALTLLQLTVLAKDLSFHPVPNQPYLQSDQTMIDSEEYNTVIVRMRSDKSGTGRLFWLTSYDKQFNQQRNIWFNIKPGEKNYYFNIPSQNPNWIGWVKGLLLYPETNGQIEVNSAEIVRGNLFTNIISGWQEFWGPKGRIEVGSTINLISSSSIYGRSINIYIYWIVALAFFAFLLFYFAKQKDVSKAYKFAIRSTIILMIGFWILLTINADINYFGLFRKNFGKYFGKSIETKRSIAYGREYYDFLVFAKEKLPQNPVDFSIVSKRPAMDLQARIYLVPHIFVRYNETKPSYLLVYHPGHNQKEVMKGYKQFSKLNNNAYILKKDLK